MFKLILISSAICFYPDKINWNLNFPWYCWKTTFMLKQKFPLASRVIYKMRTKTALKVWNIAKPCSWQWNFDGWHKITTMEVEVGPFCLINVEENLENFCIFHLTSFKTFKGVSLRVKSPPTLQRLLCCLQCWMIFKTDWLNLIVFRLISCSVDILALMQAFNHYFFRFYQSAKTPAFSLKHLESWQELFTA